jgi:hypothetical protein
MLQELLNSIWALAAGLAGGLAGGGLAAATAAVPIIGPILAPLYPALAAPVNDFIISLVGNVLLAPLGGDTTNPLAGIPSFSLTGINEGLQSLLNTTVSLLLDTGSLDLRAIEKDLAAIPIVGGYLAPLARLLPAAIEGSQSLINDGVSFLIDTGSLDPNAIAEYIWNLDFSGIVEYIGKLDLSVIEKDIAAIPIAGGYLAPLVRLIPPAVRELQALQEAASLLIKYAGELSLSELEEDIAAIPIVGGVIAQAIKIVPTMLRWLEPAFRAVGLDPIADLLNDLEWISAKGVLSDLSNIPQELQSGIGVVINSTIGLIGRGLGDVSRATGDLNLSWQWFLNPENPRGYNSLVGKINPFNAPSSRPRLKVDQPLRIKATYFFPDIYFLSHNLIPSRNVAGGRI